MTISIGVGVDGLAETSVAPSDVNCAVGPNHVIVIVNEQFRIHNKSDGSTVSTTDLATLFAALDTTGGVFDPSVFYDAIASRFVIVGHVRHDATTKSYIDLAVSDSSDPTAGFTEIHQFEIDQGGLYYPDAGKIGYNADAYVCICNLFTFSGDTASGSIIIAVDKSTVLDANNSTITSYTTTKSGGPYIPAHMHGSSGGDPLWVVSTTTFGNSSIFIYKMTNILSNSPTFAQTIIPVNSYSAPSAAPEPDGATFDTGDCRAEDAKWNNNQLVTTHNNVISGDPVVRWYQVDTSGAAPKLVQQGDIHPGAGIATFYGSISINSTGYIAIGYGQSSLSQYPSVYVTGRMPTDNAGTLEPAILVKSGTAAINGRGGDYSGIALDPSTSTIYWHTNEYGGANTWNTWLQQFTLDNSAIPVPHVGLTLSVVF